MPPQHVSMADEADKPNERPAIGTETDVGELDVRNMQQSATCLRYMLMLYQHGVIGVYSLLDRARQGLFIGGRPTGCAKSFPYMTRCPSLTTPTATHSHLTLVLGPSPPPLPPGHLHCAVQGHTLVAVAASARAARLLWRARDAVLSVDAVLHALAVGTGSGRCSPVPASARGQDGGREPLGALL